jgi:nitroreductase
VEIHELIRKRWSPRAVDPDRPVEEAKLKALLEAARWAPSCFNDQPWVFLVFDSRDPSALGNARSCLMEGNAWARRAPVLLISVARDNFAHNGKPNRHAQHDVGLATENLLLQAAALGLVTHPMAGFDEAKARELFGIPEDHTVLAMITVGYPGDPRTLDEPLRQRESAPRTRKELSEVAFRGGWGRPLG